MADSNEYAVAPAFGPASLLVESTSDAMDNIFDVEIDWPWDTGENKMEAAVSYRCSGFTPPNPSSDVYDVFWHGVAVKKIKSGVKLDRTLNLKFRLDANYALYSKFRAWQRITSDANTSGVANTASALGTVRLRAPGAEYNAQSFSVPDANSLMLSQVLQPTTSMLVWTFKDAQCYDVGQPVFNNKNTGDKQDYDVKFVFGDVGYPWFMDTTKSDN